MDRYRSYGPQDDTSANVGDYGFEGANYYDRPENLQPGQVQAATNIDFTHGVAETRGGFVCIPELGNQSFYTWNAATSGISISPLEGVAFGNGKFVAITGNISPARTAYSTDGDVWTNALAVANYNWKAICFGNNKFVAVADSGGTTDKVMTSSDGISWSLQTAINSGWSGVCYGNGKYVAVAVSGTTRSMYSTDGASWSAGAISSSYQWARIAYGNGRYVALSSDTPLQIAYSTDASAWTIATTSGLSQGVLWYDIAFGNGKFVAVAANGRTAVSSDGVTWVEYSTNGPAAAPGGFLTFGGDRFVTGNINATTTNNYYSFDGISWRTWGAAPLDEFRGIAYGNGIYVAVATVTGTGSYAAYISPQNIFACTTYSDPNDATQQWIALAGYNEVAFYAFGQASRTVAYPTGFTLYQQGTLVQANNQLYLFPGTGQTPIYWDGNWDNGFVAVPDTTAGAGFESIPESNHATYYQNRLWPVNGKDQVSASDVLDFTTYDQIANSFNLNTGSADYVVCTYPFGDNSLVVFKHNSSVLLENVQGSLNDVTATEITRNLGIVGINAVTAVGPDLVYVSDRNISTIQLNLQNKLQNVTEPLSRNIGPLIGRINWQYAYKISMGYWDNRLFVAVPMDDSTVCNTIFVYNFITKQWYGEWTFSNEISMSVLGFVVANYLGQLRLHVVTEDGRIFVTDQGQNDISGSTVAEISTSFTTRAYNTNNTAHRQRRLYIDIETNRPEFSVAAYTDGANESSTLLTDQTYSRSESWKFNDSTYTLTNANDDFNRPYRRDYSTGPNSVQCGSGFLPEMTQAIRLPLIVRRQGRLSWINITNTQGYLLTRSVGFEALPGQRSSLVQV